MWIILILYATATFTIVVEDEDLCHKVIDLNNAHWQMSGQQGKAVCLRTFDI